MLGLLVVLMSVPCKCRLFHLEITCCDKWVKIMVVRSLNHALEGLFWNLAERVLMDSNAEVGASLDLAN
jgi:hypothetical protein